MPTEGQLVDTRPATDPTAKCTASHKSAENRKRHFPDFSMELNAMPLQIQSNNFDVMIFGLVSRSQSGACVVTGRVQQRGAATLDKLLLPFYLLEHKHDETQF